MGVGLTALQRDPDGDLSERAASQRIRSRESLTAEQHMHAKRTALADEPIQQQSRLL